MYDICRALASGHAARIEASEAAAEAAAARKMKHSRKCKKGKQIESPERERGEREQTNPSSH